MKPKYVGDFFSSLTFYRLAIEKYDKGIKKVNFMKNFLEEILTILIGKYFLKIITFALALWISNCRKNRDNYPSIDDFVKFI